METYAQLPICSRSAIQASVIDSLEQADLLRRWLPWQANLGKRLVKTPKIYFRYSGLFHTLCGIPSAAELLTNPKLGASWEDFKLDELWVVYPGPRGYALDDRINVRPLANCDCIQPQKWRE